MRLYFLQNWEAKKGENCFYAKQKKYENGIFLKVKLKPTEGFKSIQYTLESG